MPGTHPGSRTPPKIEHMYSIKVDNLSYSTTMGDVERYFKKYGELGDIYIPRDRNTHESRGFAFVRYYEERDAEDAMDSMDGKVIDGREIRVALARYGRPTNQYDPRRQGGGRGYRDNQQSSKYGGGSRDRHRDNNRGGDRKRSSPPRRRRSRSRSRSNRHSRSRSRSPRYHKRSPSPRRSRSPKRSPRRSQSPRRQSASPRRSQSPQRSVSPRRSRTP